MFTKYEDNFKTFKAYKKAHSCYFTTQKSFNRICLTKFTVYFINLFITLINQARMNFRTTVINTDVDLYSKCLSQISRHPPPCRSSTRLIQAPNYCPHIIRSIHAIRLTGYIQRFILCNCFMNCYSDTAGVTQTNSVMHSIERQAYF